MADQLTASTAPEQGLLAKVSTEVVRTLKDSFGKGPLKAKSYLLDDFLLVVMRGGVTVAAAPGALVLEEQLLLVLAACGHGSLP